MSEATREEKDRLLFDGIATQYARKDLMASSAAARRRQLMWALEPVLEARPNLGTVVDIGCGIGAPARYLAGRYARYIGIDQSPAMIDAAREFNWDNDRAEFMEDNIKSTHLPVSVADVILSIGALHHMTDLDAVLTSLALLARRDAFLVVLEPHNGNPVIQLMRDMRVVIDASYSAEQVHFTSRELVELFEKHGIRDILVDYHGYLSPPFAQVILRPQMLFTPLSRVALRIDSWLHHWLPGVLRPLSFNVVVIGRFSN